MDTAKTAQVGTQSRTHPFAGIAVDFAYRVAVVIARPFALRVTDCTVMRVQTRVVGGFIGKQQRAARWNRGADAGLVGVFAHPIAYLTTLAAEN